MICLWQITDTKPNGWGRVTASSLEAAVIAIGGHYCGHGRQVVNIAEDSPKNKWPNGAPFKIHRFEIDVNRPDPTKVA
jgi:hypothetical protein